MGYAKQSKARSSHQHLCPRSCQPTWHPKYHFIRPEDGTNRSSTDRSAMICQGGELKASHSIRV